MLAPMGVSPAVRVTLMLRGKTYGQLLDASDRDSLPLLDGERMVGRFELDRGAQAAAAQPEIFNRTVLAFLAKH